MDEASIELEAQKDKESREGHVRRFPEGMEAGGNHSTTLHKLMKQELRMTRPSCVIR